jgi:uncharacterized membrane protein
MKPEKRREHHFQISIKNLSENSHRKRHTRLYKHKNRNNTKVIKKQPIFMTFCVASHKVREDKRNREKNRKKGQRKTTQSCEQTNQAQKQREQRKKKDEQLKERE